MYHPQKAHSYLYTIDSHARLSFEPILRQHLFRPPEQLGILGGVIVETRPKHVSSGAQRLADELALVRVELTKLVVLAGHEAEPHGERLGDRGLVIRSGFSALGESSVLVLAQVLQLFWCVAQAYGGSVKIQSKVVIIDASIFLFFLFVLLEFILGRLTIYYTGSSDVFTIHFDFFFKMMTNVFIQCKKNHCQFNVLSKLF